MKEFAFDVKLSAVVRVMAKDEAEARGKVQDLQCIEINKDFDGVRITEASVDNDEFENAELFEVK